MNTWYETGTHTQKKNTKTYGFVLLEQPSRLSSRKTYIFRRHLCRYNITGHQNIYFIFYFSFRFLNCNNNVWIIVFFKTKDQPVCSVICLSLLTSYLILWNTFNLLSKTVRDWFGLASPLNMKLISPLSHFMSLKSTSVVSIL